MYSFDETHYLSLKQRGEKTDEKENYSGIALCGITAYSSG